MTRLLWDQAGAHVYETGIDRGVLYLADRSGVPWNGLTSVTETTSTRILTPSYHDGVKFADHQVVGEYNGTLTAFTYPDEFLEYEGNTEHVIGVSFGNQLLQRFCLSYRTLVGDDTKALKAGYKIHVLFNLLAVPQDTTFTTLNDTPEALAFEWTLTSVPEMAEGYLPVSHVTIDSRTINDDLLADLENMLYGDDLNDPQLPVFADFMEYLEDWVGLVITDNGDGTWSATGTSQYIKMLDATTFELDEANATYLDANTYTISSGDAD